MGNDAEVLFFGHHKDGYDIFMAGLISEQVFAKS
jgi:hypothetical protein